MLDLALVTNDICLAQWCEAAGVERVLVDLEVRGKVDRQRGAELFLSTHTLEDVERIRAAITETRLEVRIDQWHQGSEAEVGEVLSRGADIVMLAMVATADQARALVDAVAGRAGVSLLVETGAGIAAIDDLVAVDGVDEIHIGLNDLQLSTGRRVPFEAVADLVIDPVAAAVRNAGLGFGLGGVTSPLISGLPIEPSVFFGEQARLATTVAWLGRSFRNGITDEQTFRRHLDAVREIDAWWRIAPAATIEKNHAVFVEAVSVWASGLTP